MKRKLLYSDIALAVLATIFSIAAYTYTRGLDIYVISTNVGAFLVTAWQIAAPVAFILWIPALVVGVRKLTRKKSPEVARPDVRTDEVMEAGALIKPNKGKQKKTSGNKDDTLIKPRSPALSSEKTELITESDEAATSDVSGLVDADAAALTELVDTLSDDATELVEGYTADAAMEFVGESANETAASLTEREATTRKKGETQFVSESVLEEPASIPTEPATGDTAVKKTASSLPISGRGKVYCSECGVDVTGKKFCPQCGKKVET